MIYKHVNATFAYVHTQIHAHYYTLFCFLLHFCILYIVLTYSIKIFLYYCVF